MGQPVKHTVGALWELFLSLCYGARPRTIPSTSYCQNRHMIKCLYVIFRWCVSRSAAIPPRDCAAASRASLLHSIFLSKQRLSRWVNMCKVLHDFIAPIMNDFRMTRPPPTPALRLALNVAQRSDQTACVAPPPRLSGGFKMQRSACDLSTARPPPPPMLTRWHTQDADGV